MPARVHEAQCTAWASSGWVDRRGPPPAGRASWRRRRDHTRPFRQQGRGRRHRRHHHLETAKSSCKVCARTYLGGGLGAEDAGWRGRMGSGREGAPSSGWRERRPAVVRWAPRRGVNRRCLFWKRHAGDHVGAQAADDLRRGDFARPGEGALPNAGPHLGMQHLRRRLCPRSGLHLM